MLTFEGVKKAYGTRQIIDIPKLAVHPGVYWLKGSNGAGKSTILKMIAGMIPFEGTIAIGDHGLKKSPVHYRRLVNYIEAEPLYPPFLTGTDLIRFVTKARSSDEGQVNALRTKLKVSDFEMNPVNTYSSGMVKRLSLVLAFIGHPQLILLDEPLVTIDKDTIPLLYELITEAAASGISFMIASHQALDQTRLPKISEIEMADARLRVLTNTGTSPWNPTTV